MWCCDITTHTRISMFSHLLKYQTWKFILLPHGTYLVVCATMYSLKLCLLWSNSRLQQAVNVQVHSLQRFFWPMTTTRACLYTWRLGWGSMTTAVMSYSRCCSYFGSSCLLPWWILAEREGNELSVLTSGRLVVFLVLLNRACSSARRRHRKSMNE